MLNLFGFDGISNTFIWYRLNLTVQIVSFAENQEVRWNADDMVRALKCLMKIRTPLQDSALRLQLFTKVSDRIVAEAQGMKAMEFLSVFSAHRKTFLTEIRIPKTKSHVIYLRAR